MRSRRAVLAGLAMLAFGVLAVGHGRATSHFTLLNDFWGNAFAANAWEWSATQQWNGFFPPGYPGILRLLPGDRLVESAYYFNVAAGLALLVVVWAFLRRVAGDTAALAAVVVVPLHPLVATQIITTGPDAFFVTLAVAGALAAFAATEARCRTHVGWCLPACCSARRAGSAITA